jgi:hypothetical protein
MFRLNWMRHACDRWPGRSNGRWVLLHKPQHDVQGRLPQQRPLRRDVQRRGAHGRLLLQGPGRPGPPCLLVHLAVSAGADDDVPWKYGVVAYGWEWCRSIGIQLRVRLWIYSADPTR